MILAQTNPVIWIVLADLALVCAHFIPLAYVFRVPAYLLMGILWLVAIIVSMFLIPSSTIIGHVSAWFTFPSACCIAITWLTVFYLMVKNRKSVQVEAQIQA
jgi:hypothetical protein